MHLDIIKVYYSLTNAQVIVLKYNIKIYIKIAATCFCTVTPSSGSSLSVHAKVTLIKIVNYGPSVCDKPVVMWLHVLVVSLMMCMMICSGVVYSRTVRHTRTSTRTLPIYAATSPLV